MHYKVWPSLRFATFCVTKQLFSHKNLYGRNLQFADQTYLNEANFSEVKTSLQSNALNSTTDPNHCQIFPQQFMQNSQMFKCPASFQISQEIYCSTNLDAKESKFHPQLFKKCINRWLVVQKCTYMFKNPSVYTFLYLCIVGIGIVV